MGAWIEGVGSYLKIKLPCVAPFMGAWIEGSVAGVSSFPVAVAPFMGAWIEGDCNAVFSETFNWSHPLWVRGLKVLFLHL